MPAIRNRNRNHDPTQDVLANDAHAISTHAHAISTHAHAISTHAHAIVARTLSLTHSSGPFILTHSSGPFILERECEWKSLTHSSGPFILRAGLFNMPPAMQAPRKTSFNMPPAMQAPRKTSFNAIHYHIWQGGAREAPLRDQQLPGHRRGQHHRGARERRSCCGLMSCCVLG